MMSRETAKLNLVIESEDEKHITVAVHGDLTHSSLEETDLAALKHLIAAKRVLLDLSECQRLDSAGVGWLIRLRRICSQCNEELVVRNVPEHPRRILRHLNLEQFFRITNDAESWPRKSGCRDCNPGRRSSAWIDLTGN